ncbi:LysR family transcriptional regulator [Motiliproteus sp. SC1-56]|uniref:LysR family transcriptional regulator n=1 Tax=Motiliproteus sp. SC1-56 TaxID=2799565 RepID=UPI001A900DA3|nr:LysR family transcriptional regulator [Motiliproteus sp. SC1-56]
MDLRALHYFEAVYEGGSISAAARLCYIAQPSISAAIRQLETQLGARLFVRHPRGVSPTKAGEQLYPLSKKLTGEARAIQRLFAAKPRPEPFRLGLMRSLGAERMSLLLKELVAAEEALELTLVNPEEPCDARIIDAVDLAPGERFQPLWLDRYQLALPLGHELSLGERIACRDLAGIAFINRDPCSALVHLRRHLHELGVEPAVRANIRTLEYALALVSAGVGCALVPDWESTRARDDIVLRPLAEIRLEQQIGLAYRADAALTPVLQRAIDLCCQRWQEERSG